MNGGSASSCIDASIQDITGRAAGIVQRRIEEPADRRGIWRLWLLGGQELRTENRRNDDFMAVFSHELRNSLGAIRYAAAILRTETSAGPAAVSARAIIERQVAQMTRLVEDLLDTSRIQRGQLRLQLERVDLCAVLRQCLQTVELAMRERNHRLTASFPTAPLWLQADASRLEQVFVNLLLNAAKYTDIGGEVALSVERHADEAIVRIRDTGIGIAPEVLPNVFDLFVQADASRRGADVGLGIGLALVRALVEGHGGGVSAASPGLQQGSEFTVCLPTPEQD